MAYLEEARALGDRLIVAVNDDASVARLKGEGRPVNGIAQRMRVLAALASVDWTVSFGEDTPEALLEVIKPDVLVKGGDYRDRRGRWRRHRAPLRRRGARARARAEPVDVGDLGSLKRDAT